MRSENIVRLHKQAVSLVAFSRRCRSGIRVKRLVKTI
jgi:hypothetical protein